MSRIRSSEPLLVTRMDGPRDREQSSVTNPDWLEIEGAIRCLDGKTCTLLILGIGDPVPHMGIGGGDEGQYIVYATSDNKRFHTLINASAPPGKRLLVAGGQRGDYEIRILVALPEVLRAARTYALSGQCDPTLTWETK